MNEIEAAKIEGQIEAFEKMRLHLGDCSTCNPQFLIWINKQLKELRNE